MTTGPRRPCEPIPDFYVARVLDGFQKGGAGLKREYPDARTQEKVACHATRLWAGRRGRPRVLPGEGTRLRGAAGPRRRNRQGNGSLGFLLSNGVFAGCQRATQPLHADGGGAVRPL